MGTQYEVKTGFNSPQGQFVAGELIPGDVAAGWPTETLSNRLLNGDIAVQSTPALEVSSHIVPAPLPESVEGENSPTDPAPGLESQEDAKEAQSDTTATPPSETAKSGKKGR